MRRRTEPPELVTSFHPGLAPFARAHGYTSAPVTEVARGDLVLLTPSNSDPVPRPMVVLANTVRPSPGDMLTEPGVVDDVILVGRTWHQQEGRIRVSALVSCWRKPGS